ncbi:MAG: tetratricopeptide repeat protein [Deltaproteobacteria bacterium]|nr:tetratricopeptide repeat protein [Deltaproteobacteria bacterium]
MGGITDSFTLLRRLALTFAGAGALTAKHRRSAVRWAVALGNTSVPICARELERDGNDDRTGWAYTLLVELADAGHRERVVESLNEIAAGATSDGAKLRAIAVLTDLGEQPVAASLSDPAAARAESMKKLAAGLKYLEDVAQAASMVLAQLTEGELPEFLRDLIDIDARGLNLAAEVLIREELGAAVRSEIELLVRGQALPKLGSSRSKRYCCEARHPDGHVVLVVWRRRAASSPARFRSASALIAPTGVLAELQYGDNMTRSDIEGRLVAGFRARGFDCTNINAEKAGRDLLEALRHFPASLPMEFYLARDLFVLGPGDHLAHRPALPIDTERTVARAFEAYRDGDLDTSEKLFESLQGHEVRAHSGLGLCAMAKGELERAERAFERAIERDPQSAENFWNLAALAHKRGCRGSCYIALTAFVAKAGRRDDRLAQARAFVLEFERLARLQHPETDPMAVATADRDDTLGRRAVGEGKLDDGYQCFLRATRRVDSHFVAWTDLAMLLARQGRSAEARVCARRALATNPTYQPARSVLDLLASVEESRATRRPGTARNER